MNKAFFILLSILIESSILYSQDLDVGFSPFIGTTTSGVNLRDYPGSKGNIIKIVPANSTIYVYSDKDINLYYKTIDVKSGNHGWIHKNFVKFQEKADVNYSGGFQSTGTTSNYNSEVIIKNKSELQISLDIEGDLYSLIPNSTGTYHIKPGRKYYIATAPGVIPASGYQVFESNHGYEWEFWVATTTY